LNRKFAAVAIAILMIIGLIPALSIPRVNAQECELFGDSPMCVFLHPGVADAYKMGWSHTLDTLWSSQDMTGSQQRQVFDDYLDYAILAKSVGDLQFDLQVEYAIGYIEIYVPPEFKWLGPTIEESIWTDITNDNMFIQTFTATEYDPIAPNWLVIHIGWDPFSWGVITIRPDTYHIRLFNLQAPERAGLYHFKIYTSIPGTPAAATSIGAGNFPFVIVKTELNPAYAGVLVRTHAFCAPPLSSGWVLAEGTTPEGRTVEGVGYWGPMEDIGCSTKPGEFGELYQVWMFGLAAGTYTFTAEATGFGKGVAERVTLEAGQSMESIFILIYDSPDVSVTVYSKHGTGEIPWHNIWQLPCGTNDPYAPPDDNGPRRDMMLELYDADNNLIAFYASNVCPAAGSWKYIPDTTVLGGLHDDGGVIPTATVYTATLTDNEDLLGNARWPTGNPSTHWDGHVPWDTADYIAGMPGGQYTVEAFVTGYVMDDADAYQRTFSLTTSAMNVVFDLRRSNWIEVTMHSYSGATLSKDTTVVLTAEDAAGSERGAAAFTQPGGPIDGGEIPTIVIEGWNGVFPNVGSGRTRGAAAARELSKKDYGLNPTASTHSAGAVSLAGNPYTIKLYMSDMGDPSGLLTGTPIVGSGWWNIIGGDPQVSVFLCNSPASLSFSITNAWLWISLRSVDFQVPAHSRPWTFPGSEIWVEFTDAEGNAVAWLDPTIYGLVQDPDGVTPFDIDNVNPPGFGEHLGVTYAGLDLVEAGWGGIMRAVSGELRSTRLPAGQYTYAAYTHGYIMRRSFPVQVPFSGGGDIEADMIQGGQIRVLLEFRHEGEATPFNGFVRVEVFNEAGDLVGASIYGQAEPNVNTLQGMGGGYLGYQAWADHMLVQGPAQATGWPGSDSDGLTGDPRGAGANPAQRAWWSSVHYPGFPGFTWADWTATDPSDANCIEQGPDGAGLLEYFDVYGFYWYFGGAARTWAGGWPTVTTWSGPSAWTGIQWDSGLRGSVDIPGWSGSGGGTYTVKVWAFDPRGPDDEYGTADDWRMYSMGWPLEGIEVPWGGANALFMTMNNMASLRGTVRWFDMFGNLRSLPWAQITASPGPETDAIPAYSAGYGAVGAGPSDPAGAYIMWVPAGSHDVGVSTSEAPQVWTSAAPTSNMDYTAVITAGGVQDTPTQLGQSGVPVPELPPYVAPLALFAALAASVWLLRKRNINAPVLMK